MFTIKKYDTNSMDYTAYSCRSYSVKWKPETPDAHAAHYIYLDPVLPFVAGDPQQIICVNSRVYIENAAGKTIDHFDVCTPEKQAA